MLLMVMKQPFHSSDLRVFAWFGMETVFSVREEWDLYMLCRWICGFRELRIVQNGYEVKWFPPPSRSCVLQA